jgi:hypothetical protein
VAEPCTTEARLLAQAGNPDNTFDQEQQIGRILDRLSDFAEEADRG